MNAQLPLPPPELTPEPPAELLPTSVLARFWLYINLDFKRFGQQALEAVLYSNTLVARCTCAAVMTCLAVGLWMAQVDLYEQGLSRLAMRVALPQSSWAVLATIAALGLWWRLIANDMRVKTAILINTYATVLWLLLTLMGLYSGLLLALCADLGVLLLFVWITLRTAFTAIDRVRS